MKQTDTSRSRETELKEEIKDLRRVDWIKGQFGFVDANDVVERRYAMIWEREKELKGIAEGRRLQKIEDKKRRK